MLTGFIVGVRSDHAGYGCTWRTRDACAFDVLAMNGDDLRRLVIEKSRTKLVPQEICVC
jgi:hypothetical protein